MEILKFIKESPSEAIAILCLGLIVGFSAAYKWAKSFKEDYTKDLKEKIESQKLLIEMWKDRLLAKTEEFQGSSNEYDEQVKALKDRIKALEDEITKHGSGSGKFPVATDSEVDDSGSSIGQGPTTNANAGKDRFGSRLGTKKAQANSVISDTPKSMKEILRDAGFSESETMYNHMNAMVKAGHFEKTYDNKYKLKSPG